MGERRPGRDHELRLTMSEAAKVLNTSRDAIRMRVRRGSLASELGEDGKRYVYVEPDRDGDRDGDDHHDLLYSEMRERIAYLERQVEEEREARRRADMLLARLVERVPRRLSMVGGLLGIAAGAVLAGASTGVVMFGADYGSSGVGSGSRDERLDRQVVLRAGSPSGEHVRPHERRR